MAELQDFPDLGVDRESDVPLATQLSWRLRTLIATGALGPSRRLPGVRELAELAGVNVNTARAVLARLEEEGYTSSQHGRGTFVAERPPVDDGLEAVAAEAVREAQEAGVDVKRLAAALFVAGEGPEPAPPLARSRPTGDERRRRRALKTEIAEMEGDLALLEGATAEPATPVRRHSGRILTAEELEEIRDRLRDRLNQLRAEKDELRQASRARRAAEEEARREGAAPAWRDAGQWTRGKRPAPRVVWTPS